MARGFEIDAVFRLCRLCGFKRVEDHRAARLRRHTHTHTRALWSGHPCALPGEFGCIRVVRCAHAGDSPRVFLAVFAVLVTAPRRDERRWNTNVLSYSRVEGMSDGAAPVFVRIAPAIMTGPQSAYPMKVAPHRSRIRGRCRCFARP